jgi:hypothetical protein
MILASLTYLACMAENFSWDPVGLSMRRLQIQLFVPYSSSISAHSQCYEPSTELTAVLNHPNFRFDSDSRKGSQGNLLRKKSFMFVKVMAVPAMRRWPMVEKEY